MTLHVCLTLVLSLNKIHLDGVPCSPTTVVSSLVTLILDFLYLGNRLLLPSQSNPA